MTWLLLSYHYLLSAVAQGWVILHIYFQYRKFPSIGLLRRSLVDILIAWLAEPMCNHFIHLPSNHFLTFGYLMCDLRPSGQMYIRDRWRSLNSLLYQGALWLFCLVIWQWILSRDHIVLWEMRCHVISSHNTNKSHTSSNRPNNIKFDNTMR